MGEGIILLSLHSLIIPCVFCSWKILCMTKWCQYVTDAAPCDKSYSPFQVLFHKTTHVTCLTYSSYRIAEMFHSNFPNINSLISSVKIKIKKCLKRLRLEGKDLLKNLMVCPFRQKVMLPSYLFHKRFSHRNIVYFLPPPSHPHTHLIQVFHTAIS
jgi:hypothetical protein